MFVEEYKKVYDDIYPAENSLDRILERVEKKKRRTLLRPVMVSAAALLLSLRIVVPVMAEHIPAVYNIIQEYMPELAEFLLPQEVVCTREGITMQVEAIEIKENTAKILISFRDAENSGKDLIQGKVDLYDSYHLKNHGASWQAAGCNFLEYSEEEDKAYFKIDLYSSKDYEKNRVRFQVNQLLTRCVQEEREIDLKYLQQEPAEKVVSLNGIGGVKERTLFPFWEGAGTFDSPQPKVRVMDIVTLNEEMLEELMITGIGYTQGILRVQLCRGTFSEADRYMKSYLKDIQGNEIPCDCSVGWQEEINGERVLFEEQWFIVSEEELEQCRLYGMFNITDGSVKGKWEVAFKLE